MRKSSVQRGFTLIELLIVFTVFGILLASGIAAYGRYNKGQSLQVGTADVLNLLNDARSRSINQVKPTECGANNLSNYQVQATPNGTSYALQVVCGGSTYTLLTKNLPPDVLFTSATASMTIFNISTGVARNSTIIGISNGTTTKSLTVQSSGTIISN